MKIKPMLNMTFFAILVVIFLQACSSNGISSTASSTSRISFSGETSIEANELEIKPEMSSNILTIKKMNLKSGQLIFKLSSPDGHIQWEETFTAPADYQHTLNLEVTPGTWKLQIELKDATGNYDLAWKASN